MKKNYKFALIALFLLILIVTCSVILINNLIWKDVYQRLNSKVLPQPKQAEQITNILPIPLDWTKYRNEEFGFEFFHDPSTAIENSIIYSLNNDGNDVRNLRLHVCQKEETLACINNPIMTLYVSAERDRTQEKSSNSNTGWLPEKIVLNALNSQSRENFLDTAPAVERNYEGTYHVISIHNNYRYSLSFR
ncbi:MAG: hypothetical protein AAB649_02600, partial [Patescibacteria group bacterium]